MRADHSGRVDAVAIRCEWADKNRPTKKREDWNPPSSLDISALQRDVAPVRVSNKRVSSPMIRGVDDDNGPEAVRRIATSVPPIFCIQRPGSVSLWDEGG